MLFPPRCLACDGFVETQGTMCHPCWEGTNFIAPPFCPCCGYPFASSEVAGLYCGHCIETTPEFTTARSVMTYESQGKTLVLGLKYGDRTQGVPTYARWLARVAQDALAESDWIVPVPLHPLRLVARRFNQSALLARELAHLSGVPYHAGLLRRVRRTTPQAGLSRRQRQHNVAGAFAVPARVQPQLNGKTVLLVDDVVTTQATVNQCAKALKQRGAKTVHVASLALATVSS